MIYAPLPQTMAAGVLVERIQPGIFGRVGDGPDNALQQVGGGLVMTHRRSALVRLIKQSLPRVRVCGALLC